MISQSRIETEKLLAGISNYARLVFSLGCAEWVLARLSHHLESNEARDYLDACWAHALSADYAAPVELDDEDWKGPVRGPVDLALTTVLNTVYGFDEASAQIDAAFAEQVALHVLGPSGEFLRWRDLVLDRLTKFSPFEDRDPLGPRLPMEVLDPAITVDPAKLEELREKNLSRLHLDGNPYVLKPR